MYNTELMQRILMSKAVWDIIDELAPIYGEARVALWLFQVIGAELDMTRQWTQETAEQVVPHTATWSLDYWEDELALPRNPALNTEQRRERILTYLRTRAPMNPYNLAKVASAAADGAECWIEERAGHPSSFIIHMTGFPASGVTEKVRKAVDRAKQARLSFYTAFEENTNGSVYTGGEVQLGYSLTMRQDGNIQEAANSLYVGGVIQMGYDLSIRQGGYEQMSTGNRYTAGAMQMGYAITIRQS